MAIKFWKSRNGIYLESEHKIKARRRRRHKRLAILGTIFFLLTAVLPFTTGFKRFGTLFAQPATPNGVFNPYHDQVVVQDWCLVGDFQQWDGSRHPLNDAGVDGDARAGDGIYSRTHAIGEAGNYSWQAIECQTWNIIFPAEPAWLETYKDNQFVTFTIDTTIDSRRFRDTFFPKQYILNTEQDEEPRYLAVGDFQGWQNNTGHTELRSAGFGRFWVALPINEPGSYSGYVVAANRWQGFGANGRSTDPHALSVTTKTPDEIILFWLNNKSGRLAMYRFSRLLTILFFGWGRIVLAGLCLLFSLRAFILWLSIELRSTSQLVYTGRCPKCSAETLRRSHRSLIDRLIDQVGFPSRRYRCVTCAWSGLQLS